MDPRPALRRRDGPLEPQLERHGLPHRRPDHRRGQDPRRRPWHHGPGGQPRPGWGTTTAKGSAASPILFTSPGDSGKVNQWQQLHVAGGTAKSDLAYVTVEYTNRGVQLGSGAHVLDHVTVRRSAQEGLRANNSTNVKLSARTLKENTGRGLWITSGKLDMKGNYWGDGSFPNPVPLLSLSRTDAVDVQGPQPFQINGTGPQK